MQVWSPNAVPVGILRWNGPSPRLTVIAKLTLVPKDGTLVPAQEQEPLQATVPSKLGVIRELYQSGDFVPFKKKCDFMVVGSAYTSSPSSVIPVHLRLGAHERYLFAHTGEPSTSVPLSSLYLRDDSTSNAWAVSVGPLSPLHPQRAVLVDKRIPERASDFERITLPANIDGQCFQAAPREQQVDSIVPGIALVAPFRNLERHTFWLPGLRPRVFRPDPANHTGLSEIAMRCDTLWIDTVRERCVLTFRGMIEPLPDPRFPTSLIAIFGYAQDAMVPGAAALFQAQAQPRPAIEPHMVEASARESVAGGSSRTLGKEDESSEAATRTYTSLAQRAGLQSFSLKESSDRQEKTAVLVAGTGASGKEPPKSSPSSTRVAVPGATRAKSVTTTYNELLQKPVVPFVSAKVPPTSEDDPHKFVAQPQSAIQDANLLPPEEGPALDSSSSSSKPERAKSVTTTYTNLVQKSPLPFATSKHRQEHDETTQVADLSSAKPAVPFSRGFEPPAMIYENNMPPAHSKGQGPGSEGRFLRRRRDSETTVLDPGRVFPALPFKSETKPLDDGALPAKPVADSGAARSVTTAWKPSADEPLREPDTAQLGDYVNPPPLPFVPGPSVSVAENAALPTEAEAGPGRPSAPASYAPQEANPSESPRDLPRIVHDSSVSGGMTESKQPSSSVGARVTKQGETKSELAGGSLTLEMFAGIKVDLWNGMTLDEALVKRGIDQRSYQLYEQGQKEALREEALRGEAKLAQAFRAALRRARERRGSNSNDDGTIS